MRIVLDANSLENDERVRSAIVLAKCATLHSLPNRLPDQLVRSVVHTAQARQRLQTTRDVMRTTLTSQSPDIATRSRISNSSISVRAPQSGTEHAPRPSEALLSVSGSHAPCIAAASRFQTAHDMSVRPSCGNEIGDPHPVEKFSPPSDTGESRLRKTLAFTPSSSSETSPSGMRCTRRRASYYVQTSV